MPIWSYDKLAQLSSNLYSSIILMILCKCLSPLQPSSATIQQPQLSHIDFHSASKYLRKVGLKVNDVSMKLGINRIIHFLSEVAPNIQKRSFVEGIEREEIKHQISEVNRVSYQNKENIVDPNQPQSFMGIQTSRSFLSQDANKNNFFVAAPISSPYTLSKAFNLKQVVTKNSLQCQQPPELHHVRFTSSIRSEADDQEHGQVVQKLQCENKALQECLKNIFTFFEEKKLLSFEGSVKDLSKQRYGDAIEQLTCNFIDYTHQIEQKIANLSAKSSLLQQTIHNMSISMRIEKDSKEEQMSKDQYLSKGVQTSKVQEETNEQQMERLEIELNEAIEAAKKSEILLYIKEEEVSSLKVIVSDLQNRLKSYTKNDQKQRSKSYKKFFEITGQNLAKSTKL